METYTYEQVLPSFTLNRELLAGLEKRLLLGIPRLLQKVLQKIMQGLKLDSHKKFESYRILVNVGKEQRSFTSTRQLDAPCFEKGTRMVRMEYSLGAPRLLKLELNFPGDRQPTIKLSTQSPQVETLLPKIADGLSAVIKMYGNRHKIMHNAFIQALVLFSMPLLVMTYGVVRDLDMFLLYSSMGWLCLLSLGVAMALPNIFPWVTFETGQRFQWQRLPLLVRFSLLIFSAGSYIALVLLNLPSAGL